MSPRRKPAPTAPAALVVDRDALREVLGVSERQVYRLEADGVLVPTQAPKRGVRSLYDLREAVPAYLTHVQGRDLSARDRRDAAQADFVELKAAQLRRDLLPAVAVHQAADQVVRAATTRLLRLADDLARRFDGDVADAVGEAVRQALEELGGLDDATGGAE